MWWRAWRPARVRPVIEVAIRRFRAHQALREELAVARQDLEERRLVDRAKAVLMQKHKLTEPEAYKRLRRMAMDRGQKLAYRRGLGREQNIGNSAY